MGIGTRHGAQGRYVAAAQLAVLCGVSRRTITNWAGVRGLPHELTPGGHRRFAIQAVCDWFGAQGLAAPPLLEEQCLSPSFGE
jgi:hypothetical protein